MDAGKPLLSRQGKPLRVRAEDLQAGDSGQQEQGAYMEGTPRYRFDNRLLSSRATAGLPSSVSRLFLRRDQASANCIADEARQVVNVKLIHQTNAMGFYRFFTAM